MDLITVHDWAKSRNAELRLDTHEELFQNSVTFSHYDGSKCLFTDSWIEVQPFNHRPTWAASFRY